MKKVTLLFLLVLVFCFSQGAFAEENGTTTTIDSPQIPPATTVPVQPPVITYPQTNYSYGAVRFGYAPVYGGVNKFKVDYTSGGGNEKYTVDNSEGRNYDLLFTFKESKEQNGLYWDMGFGVFTYKFNDITFEDENLSTSDTDVSLSSFNFIFGAGYSFQFTPWYTLELGGRGGVGVASATFDFPYIGKYDGTSGYSAMYEIGARNIFLFRKIEFGIEVGYTGSVCLVNFSDPTSEGYWIKENDTTFNASGGMVKTFIGYRF